MSAQTPVDKTSPLWLAWQAFQQSEEYANALRWAGTTPQNTEGALWAAFMAAFPAGPVQQSPDVIAPEHPRFASQRLTDGGAVRVAVVKSGCSLLLNTIETACPHNRHRSLAITALEEACMWAVKAISHEKVPL